MRVLRLLAAVSALSVTPGCHFDDPPDLVRIDRLDPPRASSGDRVSLTGDGFPGGRDARVVFRGDVFRPGREALRDVQVRLRAAPAGRNAVTVLVDPDVERRFTGKGENAAHATFHGAVQVVFQPGVTGLGEVAGTARDVTFDVLPSDAVASEEERAQEGRRALAFLGMAATPDATFGLRVGTVDGAGRAAMAGILPGDLIVDVDGVTVLSAADLRVRGGERVARMRVERDGRTRTLDVDVQGLSPLGAAAWIGAAAPVVTACGLLLLLASPLGVAIRWLARRMSERDSGREPSRPDGPAALRITRFAAPFEGRPSASAAAALVLAAIMAGFLRMAVGRAAVSPDLDLFAGTLGVSLSLLLSRVVHGARRGYGFSAKTGVGAAARTLVVLAPAIVAVLGSVVASGRFVVSEIVADQGGVPWRWAAAQNPGLLVLSLLLVASAVPEARDPLDGFDVEGLPATEARTTGTAAVRLAEWAYLWTMCGFAVLLFFGGSRVPGVSSAVQEASRAFRLFGAALFFVKLVALVALVGVVRALGQRIPVGHVSRVVARFGLPLSVAGLIVGASWATAVEAARSTLLPDLMGFVTVTMLVGVGAALLVVRSRRTTSAANLAVNPWL